MLMYPIFITDDPTARVEIPSLPGQCRWGVDRLEDFIGPLVKKGLKSVILFGVPMKCEKVCWLYAIVLSECSSHDVPRIWPARQPMTPKGL